MLLFIKWQLYCSQPSLWSFCVVVSTESICLFIAPSSLFSSLLVFSTSQIHEFCHVLLIICIHVPRASDIKYSAHFLKQRYPMHNNETRKEINEHINLILDDDVNHSPFFLFVYSITFVRKSISCHKFGWRIELKQSDAKEWITSFIIKMRKKQ